MVRRLSFLFVAGIAVALSGCSYLCQFEAGGIVREVMTGRPVDTVRIDLVNADGHSLITSGNAITSDAAGTFRFTFTTTPTAGEMLTGWKLVLTAKGYESETIQVGTVRQPKGGNDTVYLHFNVTMRKMPTVQQ